MKRTTFGVLALTGLGACNEPTRPADPSVTPPATAVAAEQQFTVRNLGTLGGPFSEGSGINEQGEVVGWANLPSGNARAFLWRPGRGMRSLGSLGGASSNANGINDRSEVVGESLIRQGSSIFRAFLWSRDRGMRGLGTLGGELSRANSINNRREVVGGSDSTNGDFRAFLWRPGRGMRSLGTLNGSFSLAFGVNTHRRVVGVSGGPFLWTAGGGMRPLPTLGGDFGEALDLNEFGQIVGTTADRATLWTPTAGPLAVEPSDKSRAPEVTAARSAPRDARTAWCALGRKLGDRSRLGAVASRACLAP